MAGYEEEEVKLFGAWGSPFSSRVEIALKMKGVKYQLIEEDTGNKSPLLLKYNPVHKKIPVLLHNGKPIAESIVIIEYIDDTWKSGTPILPQHPHQRAMARFWAKYIDDKLVPMWKSIRSTGEEQEQATKETEEALRTLENELQGKKFFGGETIGLADIIANFLGLWFGILEEVCEIKVLTQDKYPRIHQWINEYVESSVMKTSLPKRSELLSLFQTYFKPTK
ncbi:hypothetical protein DCAR_0727571 [Daucus carota subsp. sativus]|uniref:glutathione transferase n=1 Tax=Daucus carota subsp. sativus TaxID=79200 RepID=A0A164T100_DAUCS|nr:PREDICTED: glutathione S-transferase U8 [Daucus carota subsp. sativus]WOH08134.1 hypothetical protein DCAR_0727571 [Daucus carota subsp. sativus]